MFPTLALAWKLANRVSNTHEWTNERINTRGEVVSMLTISEHGSHSTQQKYQSIE